MRGRGAPLAILRCGPCAGAKPLAEAASLLASLTVVPATVPCQADATHLCLAGGRFEVSTVWETSSGMSGAGQAVPLAPAGVTQPDTGYFWFFASANVELVIKVLDGTGTNGHFWVFYGALSDVEYTITVTDTTTGSVQTYFNSQGQLASVGDTSAF